GLPLVRRRDGGADRGPGRDGPPDQSGLPVRGRSGPFGHRGRLPALPGRTLSVMRWLCGLVFALAAGSSALAAAGLAVAPHVDPPGTPLFHDHLLAAYRYPLFLLRLRMLSQQL